MGHSCLAHQGLTPFQNLCSFSLINTDTDSDKDATYSSSLQDQPLHTNINFIIFSQKPTAIPA